METFDKSQIIKFFVLQFPQIDCNFRLFKKNKLWVPPNIFFDNITAPNLPKETIDSLWPQKVCFQFLEISPWNSCADFYVWFIHNFSCPVVSRVVLTIREWKGALCPSLKSQTHVSSLCAHGHTRSHIQCVMTPQADGKTLPGQGQKTFPQIIDIGSRWVRHLKKAIESEMLPLRPDDVFVIVKLLRILGIPSECFYFFIWPNAYDKTGARTVATAWT